MASLQTEPPPPNPSGETRRRAGLFIVGFVALQFLGPLSYLVREDASDERFTWRSLTTSATPSCETRATAIGHDGTAQELSLRSLVHEDWVRFVQQGRRAVVDAVLTKQCVRMGIERVELVNECGENHEAERFSLRCGPEHARAPSRTAAR